MAKIGMLTTHTSQASILSCKRKAFDMVREHRKVISSDNLHVLTMFGIRRK